MVWEISKFTSYLEDRNLVDSPPERTYLNADGRYVKALLIQNCAKMENYESNGRFYINSKCNKIREKIS